MLIRFVIPEAVSQSAHSSPLVQELTLRTKLSLPALRSQPYDSRWTTLSVWYRDSFAGSRKNEMVQVQDTDFKFELVKPSIPQVTGRVSQDLTLTGHDVNIERPNMSPTLGNALSMHSSMPRSPLDPYSCYCSPAESIDAHRQCELKWMELFSLSHCHKPARTKRLENYCKKVCPRWFITSFGVISWIARRRHC